MTMRSIIIAGFVLALASGLFLNYPGHPWQVLAQTTNAKNATQSSTGASNATKSGGGNMTSSSGGSSSAGGGGGAGGKSTTPPSTVTTMKSGPKAVGSASQLQQIEGPNASKVLSSNAPIGNKPGVKGLTSEANTSSGAANNATSAGGSAANKTSAGTTSAASNVSGAAQSKNATNATNPLAKIPVIGKLFGGK